MQIVKNVLRNWLPLGAAITLLSGLVYLAVQQDLRQGANDPQIQMAEDAAQALAQGATVEAVVPAGQVDAARSLAPFVVVFDAQKQPVAASGQLHGQIPVVPDGVLDYARLHGQNRVSWQPEPGVRLAAVVVSYQGTKPGFVLAARSLRDVEIRESQAEFEAGAVGGLALAVTLVLVILGEIFLGERRQNTRPL